MGKKQAHTPKRGSQAHSQVPSTSAAPGGNSLDAKKTDPGSRKDKDKWKKKFAYDYSKDYADPKWPYHLGKMDRGAKIVLVVFPTCVIALIAYVWYGAHLRNMLHTPLQVPKVIADGATSAAMDPERFWGTYRSGVYFGMKTRSPQSPVFGLMWNSQMSGERSPEVRHWCEQGDRLPMYGWFTHDGVNFGLQEIVDNYFTITTDFVKRPGGDHGGDWSARVGVDPRKGAEEAVISLYFYAALDGQGHLQHEMKNDRLDRIRGYSEELGDFSLIFPVMKNQSKNIKYNVLVGNTPSLSKVKETMFSGFRKFSWIKEKQMYYVGLSGNTLSRENPNANLIIHQVTTTLPFQMEILFHSGSVKNRTNILGSKVYQQEIQKHLTNFEERFEAAFQLTSKGYDRDYIWFAKAVLSNVLGGIGYFYGSSLVKSKYVKEEPVDYWKAPLFTAVPSRSFFPRGFLWDEGFHNILISRWDQKISQDIIGHWLDLMNIEGWIPREQILGDEARAKVPDEFVVQHNEFANPPTFFLPLQRIVKVLAKSDDPKDREYLQRVFPRLETWYNWFNTSQYGEEPSSYRWRGRNAETKSELNPKTLTSGLDDYPRASHPTDKERHLDLRCWMALASGVMAEIAKSLNEPYAIYENTHKTLTDNKLLDELHWSPKKERYSDFGFHTDHVKLEKPKPKQTKSGKLHHSTEYERVTKKDPKYQFVDTTFGYNSLFPFILNIIDPTSLKLGKMLKDLQDPNLLWTRFGLRSLAKNSPLYQKYNTEHDPPYWRGAIWMNMNYLALGALHHYSHTMGPYQEEAAGIYKELRDNIIKNIYQQYRATGYLWEQYNDASGDGMGCHPFTGWSALVVAMMAEQY